MKKEDLHPDLRVFENIYFNAKNPEMEKNVGMKCRFKNPSCLAEKEIFEVVGIQFDWKREIVYRVVGEYDVYRFGRCASPERIEWIQ